MSSIGQLFQTPGKKLVPFITAGYPSPDVTIDLVLAAEKAGCHMVELGMPFSDPLADGPIIQQTSQIALNKGVTLAWILDTVAEIRTRSRIPIVLMGYINPILRMGTDIFLARAREAGVDGLIIPDLLPEERVELFSPARSAGLSTIYLVAPNTPDERIQYLGFEAQELLYAVALLGVTGASLTARQRLESYLQRVRMNTSVPFVVGFGISTTEDVRQIAALADGVVVGSALLARLKEASDPVAETHRYLGTLADALAEIDSSSMESESR